MTVTNEQIQALKAAAESCGKQEPLSLVVYHGKMCLRNKGGIVFTVIRDICFPEYSAENENYARLVELCTPDSILSLLADHDADKALIEVYSEAYKEAIHAEAVNWEAAASLAEENAELKRRISDTDDALCKLLPGVQYMDPPDGGCVTPLEQVSRMVADYRQQIAEQAKRIAELEARTLTVKLPESVIDAICLTAAEIHNLGRGVSDERAQEIINSIRCAAGITLDVGE